MTERTGVVHALAEQVLAEPALLALEHVGKRLERTVARACDGAAATAVVEQSVHGFLEHALLVIDDDLGSAEVEQALEPVVAVDHAAVEVVEIAGGETTAVELDHGAQFRRDDRDGLQDHPFRTVCRPQEAFHHFESLDRARQLLALRGLDDVAKRSGFGLQLDGRQEFADGFGAHAAAEVHAIPEGAAVLLFHLPEERLIGDDVALLDGLEGGPQLAHAGGLLIGVALEVAQAGVGFDAELGGPLLGLFLSPLGERGLVETKGYLIVLVGSGVAQKHRDTLVAFGHDLDLLLVPGGEDVLDVGLDEIL